MAPTIRDIKVICTAPEGINLVVVKVETSEPGLYGLGCATFAYRHLTVQHLMRPICVRCSSARMCATSPTCGS